MISSKSGTISFFLFISDSFKLFKNSQTTVKLLKSRGTSIGVEAKTMPMDV
jgi:hypothetical protein